MAGMGMPMGHMVLPPSGPPGSDGSDDSSGLGPSSLPPGLPPQMPPPVPMGGGGFPSTDANSLAGLVAQAIAQAQSADQAQLAAQQDAAAQGAMAHPIVQSLLGQQVEPMRGMTGDAMPPDPSMMGLQ